MDFAEFLDPGSTVSPLDASVLAAGERNLAFEDLFDLERIQHLQDEFARGTRVASVITRPDGTPITRPSNFTRLCRDITRQSEKGLANCRWADPAVARMGKQAASVQSCLSGGMWEAGAPIVVEGRHIASWFIGQVRDESRTDEQIRHYALEIDADPDEAVLAFRGSPRQWRGGSSTPSPRRCSRWPTSFPPSPIRIFTNRESWPSASRRKGRFAPAGRN